MQENTKRIKNGSWMQQRGVFNDVFRRLIAMIFKKTLEVNGVFVYSRLIVG